MVKILYGIFIILHGLVHLFYFGQSGRYFELSPEMVWPDGSWAFTRLLGEAGVRSLGSVLMVVCAAIYVIGGVGVFAGLAWWRTALIWAAGFSTLAYLLLWDGGLAALAEKGAVGILINLAILAGLLYFNWPDLEA